MAVQLLLELVLSALSVVEAVDDRRMSYCDA